MTAIGLLQTIQDTGLAVFVREAEWAYPLLETVHIFGLGLLFGSIFAYDLRVLGVQRSLPLDALGHHLMPWVWTGIMLNAVSGVIMFMSDAVEPSVKPALQVKFALIVLAGINAAIFQQHYGAMAAAWPTDMQTPIQSRAQAALSIALWLSIITAWRTSNRTLPPGVT